MQILCGCKWIVCCVCTLRKIDYFDCIHEGLWNMKLVEKFKNCCLCWGITEGNMQIVDCRCMHVYYTQRCRDGFNSELHTLYSTWYYVHLFGLKIRLETWEILNKETSCYTSIAIHFKHMYHQQRWDHKSTCLHIYIFTCLHLKSHSAWR